MNCSKWLFIILSFLIFIGGSFYFYHQLTDYYSFAKEKTITYNKRCSNDTLTVLFIGDSWAAYHSKYDNQLKNMIEDGLGIPVNVYSQGAIGAKTNAIYYYMSDTIPPFGTKSLLNKVPNYCIISAGINDAVAKLGPKNYIHHYELIIKRLLANGIKPIVLDMPDVDYKLTYQKESFLVKIRHHISSWYTNAPLWDFNEYRSELCSMIHERGYDSKIIFISSRRWNSDGYNDSRGLYREDLIHLNEKGYLLLDSCITSQIIADYGTTPDCQ